MIDNMRRRKSYNLILLAVSIVIHVFIFLSFTHPLEDGESFPSSLKRLVKAPRRGDAEDPVTGHDRALLRESVVTPVKECTVCSAAPELCKEIGENKMNRAISFNGSNDRLRRLLARIKAGKPFTMGTIGGSVSQGSGIDWGREDDPPRHPSYRPPNLNRIIFEHLHSLSPLSATDTVPFDPKVLNGAVGSATGSHASYEVSGKAQGKNTFISGAQGGTGSGYFAYCWPEHLDTDTDIFVVELAINDEPIMDRIDSYELLIRGLMDLPHKPAVISIEVFALLFNTVAFGGELHKGINEFYDIPSVSVRNPFLSQVMRDTKEVERFFRRDKGEPGDFSGMDLRHLSHLGHRMSGQLVNAHISKVMCEMERERPSPSAPWPADDLQIAIAYPIAEIAPMRLNKKYMRDTVLAPLKPQCFTMKTKKNTKLTPVAQTGWRTWSFGEKNYWISTDPGSTIDFAVSTVAGTITLHYLRSKIFGLGNVWCWIDDDKDDGKRIEGWWRLEFNVDQSTSWSDVEPGKHILHCEVEDHTADPGGGHEFRITSLTSV